MISYNDTTDDMVKLDANDQGFHVAMGTLLYQRAGIQINPDCPPMVNDAIIKAIQSGWIEPVAYMRQEEWAWARMAGDH